VWIEWDQGLNVLRHPSLVSKALGSYRMQKGIIGAMERYEYVLYARHSYIKPSICGT